MLFAIMVIVGVGGTFYFMWNVDTVFNNYEILRKESSGKASDYAFECAMIAFFFVSIIVFVFALFFNGSFVQAMYGAY